MDDQARATTDAAMVNEALCKFLCHNLCCLILSADELGIAAKFWGTDGAMERLPAVASGDDEADGIEAWGWA